MRAGLIDTPVKFLVKTKVQTGPGNYASSWGEYWITRCSKKPLKATRTLEVFQNKLSPGFTLRLRARIDKQISDDMKVEIRGVRYTIQELHPENNNLEWVLNVIEDGSNQGA